MRVSEIFTVRCLFNFVFLLLTSAVLAAADTPLDNWITRPEESFIAPAHHGRVNCILSDSSGNIITAGDDGFIVIWDCADRTARERFQLSPYAIEKAAVHPEKNELAVYESDGVGFYRVSVWNYVEKRRLYTVQIANSVLYCAYTAQGKYLLICQNNGVLLVDSENGQPQGERLGGYPVSLAVSSKTERTLQTYSVSGALSYWDIDKSSLTQTVSVPANLRSPLVFGNYRFLAGQNDEGLFVVDAVFGRAFFKTEAIRDSLLFCAEDSSNSFFRVSFSGGNNILWELFTIETNAGVNAGVVQQGEIPLGSETSVSAAAPFDTSRFLIGLDDGRLALAGIDDFIAGAEFFLFKNQRRLFDAVSVNDVIAFTGENGMGAFIPASFDETAALDSINLFNTNSANRVTSDDKNAFLFWRCGDSEGGYSFVGLEHSFPLVKFLADKNNPDSTGEEQDEYVIDDSGMSRDMRGASTNGSEVLFLDVSGNIIIFSIEEQRRIFSYSSAMSLDALFIDNRNVLVARNAETVRNTAPFLPFLMIDSVSGETLPEAYPASMAFMLYKSPLNNIYSAVLKNAGNRITTGIIKFNVDRPEASETVFEYNGEDTNFSFAEYSVDGREHLVSSAGGEGAAVILIGGGTPNNSAQKPVERTPAFPQKLFSQSNGFAALDLDGTISWYDGASGRLLAMLRLYEDEWLLSTSSGKVKRGSLSGF
jgi:hypothetical protein